MVATVFAMSVGACRSGDPAGTFASDGTNLVITHQEGDQYSLKFLSADDDTLMVATRTGRVLIAQTGAARVTVEFSEDWKGVVVRKPDESREFRRLTREESAIRLNELSRASGPRLGASCPESMLDAQLRCAGELTDQDSYTWTVSRAGKYVLTVYPPRNKVAFDPGLCVMDSTGVEVAKAVGGVGAPASSTVDARAGVYQVKIYPADSFKVRGGYSYELEIEPLR